MDEGGQVIAWNDCLERRDGHSWQAFELTNVVSWSKVDNYEQVDLVLREMLHPRTKWRSGLMERAGVTQLRRELEDGSTVYFIVNSLAEGFEDELHVSGCYGEIWDPLTGLVTPLLQADQEQISIPVVLAGSGSLLVRIYSDRNRTVVTTMDSENLSESIDATNIRKARKCMDTERSIVIAEQANIFPISYCDLQLGSKTYSGIYTLQASQLVYEYHGFPANPWDNAVQYKRRLLDRESSFGDKTGFVVQYRFDLACEDIPAEIGVMVERPELYNIYINGMLVELQLGSSWLDHHMGEGSIREVIRKGENIISLEAKPFSIFAEIETIYLTGDFLVIEQAGKWVITKQEGQRIVGSWLEQGYPFYGSAFTYQKRVAISEKANDVWVTLPDWSGTIATVQVNGNNAGMIGFDCGERLEITKYVQPGEIVEIIIRVAGSFKNLMGPHFDPLKPRNVAWPGNWKNAPIFGPPPAKAFDLIDYGLFTDFDVEINCE